MTSYLKADCFYYPTEVKPAGYLSLENDVFGEWTETAPTDAQIIDYTGYQIALWPCGYTYPWLRRC